MAQDQGDVVRRADLDQIKRMIPHRHPFLLIDSVEEIRQGDSAVGNKDVTPDEPSFEGHFPGAPIMPGVLIVEAMAPTAGVLVVETLGKIDENLLVYFMTLDKTRFRRKVVPGDVLELHVDVKRGGGKIWKFQGRAMVGGDLACEAEFTAMMDLRD